MGLWERLSEVLGWVPPEEEGVDGEWDEYGHDEDSADEWDARPARTGGEEGLWRPDLKAHESRVLSLPRREAGTLTEVAVAEPASYDDVQAIADRLKRNVGLIVNVEYLGRDEARRVVDFLSGTVYALDGEMQQVSAHVVMFVPRHVSIHTLTESTLRSSREKKPGAPGEEERPWS
ncbi:MAG: cell division protein SepF [Bacillota bacterium]